MLPIRDLQAAVAPFEIPELEARSQGLRGRVLADGGCKLMDGEKFVSILKAAKIFGFTPIDEKEFDRVCEYIQTLEYEDEDDEE